MAARLPRPHRDDVYIAVAGLLGGLLLWALGSGHPHRPTSVVLLDGPGRLLLPLVVMARLRAAAPDPAAHGPAGRHAPR